MSLPLPPYAVKPTLGSGQEASVQTMPANSPRASITSLPANENGSPTGKTHSSSSFSASGIFQNGSNGFGPELVALRVVRVAAVPDAVLRRVAEDDQRRVGPGDLSVPVGPPHGFSVLARLQTTIVSPPIRTPPSKPSS